MVPKVSFLAFLYKITTGFNDKKLGLSIGADIH